MAYYRCGGGVPSSVKSLPTYKTASGSVATFETDMTENLISCIADIVAKQASGTPSPSNPRPITTYSEMNFSATGKNLYNINNQTVTAINTFCDMYLPSNANITFSTDIVQTGLYAHYYDNGNLVEIAHIYNSRVLTFNTGNHNYIRLMTYNEGTQATEFQAEFGTTATTYEPFNGTTANIPFGQTVANGVLDITTGKLRVTHACVTLDSSLNWMKNESILTSNAFVASAQFPNYKRENGISSHFETVSSTAASSGVFFGIGVNILTPLDINLSTSNDFKQWISNNTVQVLYSLLTPTTIQLDSVQIQALLNENNVWCDTNGDTEVKFLLSVGEALRQG